MPHAHLHPRDEILEAMERIYRYRMTTTSGGNLSIREENGDVWITPARVDKGGLRREDLVCIRANGQIEGTQTPSSELPIHQEIRRRRRISWWMGSSEEGVCVPSIWPLARMHTKSSRRNPPLSTRAGVI